MRATILQWFRRRRQADGLAQADAEALTTAAKPILRLASASVT